VAFDGANIWVANYGGNTVTKLFAAAIANFTTTQRQSLSRGGKTIQIGSSKCADCAVKGATERLITAASLGRMAARTPEARAKHVVTRRRHVLACSEWDASQQPAG
jgi:hypothetical protein